MESAYFTRIDSPIGFLSIHGTEAGVEAVRFHRDDPGENGPVPELLRTCAEQLRAYFEGSRRTFDVPLRPDGTDFQRTVWNALQGIPFGQTRSYKELAEAIRNSKAIRAVGAANGQNPVNIIVPCHRVIGSDGSLTGYGGELWRKEWLLKHEHELIYGAQQALF